MPLPLARSLALLTLLALASLSCRSAPRFRAAENALGPYSAAVEAGDLVFVSGQIGAVRDGTFEAEAESAIDRVEAQLAQNGLALSDCVAATVFLNDIELYGALNEVYARRFSAPYPARACVAVRALPGGARVEIQVTAARR